MNGSWVDEIDVDCFCWYIYIYIIWYYIWYKRQYSLDLVLMPLRLAFQVISGIDVQDNATMEKLVKDVGERRPNHVAGVKTEKLEEKHGKNTENP